MEMEREMETTMRKKIICAIMIFALAALSACGARKDTDNGKEQGLAGFTEPEEDSTGRLLLDDFGERMGKDPDQTALKLAEGIISNEAIPFMGMAMEAESGFLSGFTEEITGFREAAVFGPQISTIPFVGYIFVLEEGSDVASFAENLKEKSDPAWNICTEADQTVIDYYGNTVFFLMCPESLEG